MIDQSVSVESLIQYLQETFPEGTEFIVRDMDYGSDMGALKNPQPRHCLSTMHYILPDGTTGDTYT